MLRYRTKTTMHSRQNHEMGEPPDREQCNDRPCGGGGECVKGDPVSGTRHHVTVEDGVQAHGKLHNHDQGKEPECELVTAIPVVDALGKKPVGQ
jgi:hypothetical protein